MPLYKPWVVCYNTSTVKERERRTATATFRYLKKKNLTNYRKYATIVNVKRRYQKESRLTARGQGRKLLTNYLKYAILKVQTTAQQVSSVVTDSASCQAINHCGLFSPSSINRVSTLKTEQCMRTVTRAAMRSASGVVAYSMERTM